MAEPTLRQVHRNTTAPGAADGARLMDLWQDLTASLIKKCTSISPYTWTQIGGTGSASPSFLSHADTPGSYAGQGGKLVRVAAGETALEFLTAPYLSNIVEDTTPQLGGPLDPNSQYISGPLQVGEPTTPTGHDVNFYSTLDFGGAVLVRMFWDESKGAFRAGGTSGAQWDDANVGLLSAALGYDVEASGVYAIALGGLGVASGDSAIAIGYSPDATGVHSVAIGRDTQASGDYSVAIGRAANVSTENSLAFGYLSLADGTESLAIGRSADAGGAQALALGYLANASANYALAIGRSAVASGAGNTAIGYLVNAEGAFYCVAIGSSVTMKGSYNVGIGYYNKQDSAYDYAILIGNYLKSSATGAGVIGKGVSVISFLENSTANTMMMGFGTAPSIWFGDDTLAFYNTSPIAKQTIAPTQGALLGAVSNLGLVTVSGTDRIKLLAKDFGLVHNFANLRSVDGTGDQWYMYNAPYEAVAYVQIPDGYKATHVMVYGADANNTVAVYECEIDDGTTATAKGNGNVGTEINITDVTATSTNYLAIHITMAAINDYIYGGYVIIEKA